MTDMIVRETAEDRDTHDAQAQATYQTWADRGRKLDAAYDRIDAMSIQLASLEARNIELERTNGQLNDRISESMVREAGAIAEASRLKGIMQVSGVALADGMNRDTPRQNGGIQPPPPRVLRPVAPQQ